MLTLIWVGKGYAQQYRFENYSVNSGLPQSQVYCQLQDKNGFLWLGTMGGGLARFDGRDFETFTTRDGLSNNFIHALFQLNDTLWIGTQKGLSFYCNNTLYQVEDSVLQDARITSIYKSGSNLLIGTDKALLLKKGSNTASSLNGLFDLENVYISSIFKDNSGKYWVGSSQGILQLTDLINKEANRCTTRDGLGTNDVECFAQLPSGSILAGTYGNGVYEVSDQQIRQFITERPTYSRIVHSIYVDDDIWICTQRSGVYVVNQSTNKLTQLTQNDGLANNHVRNMVKDNWGNYWIGTSGAGVSKYYGQNFQHYTKRNGLPGNYVYSIHQHSKGEMYLGISQKGLVRSDSFGFSTLGKDSGFLDRKVKAIAEDYSGNLWLGTLGEGVYVKQGNRFKKIERRSGLVAKYIKDLEYDGKSMWVASIDKGLFRVIPVKNQFSVTKYGLDSGIQSERINALCSVNDTMWYGSQSKGIGYVLNNKVVNLSIQGFPQWTVRAMRADAAGNVWVATGGNGVVRVFRDSSAPSGLNYTVYDYNNGLLSTNTYLILPVGNKLYIGSENGIDALTLNNEYDVIESDHYGYDEGFVGMETCQDAVMQDNRGSIWFGTINGLSEFKPDQQSSAALTPKISFSSIRVNLNEVKSVESQNYFNHRENTFTFEFLGVDLSRPKSVRYSYLLNGSGENWSEINAGKLVRFSNLDPGKYTFKVKATTDGENWSKPLMYSFEISRPFWRTWWFWLLCLFLIALLVVLIFRYRINRLKQKAEEDRQKYALKNELLVLEQKALRLQMNPHFLFNALNSIQGLIIKNDQKAARYYLAKFAHLMRQILDNSRTGSISLEEEIKTLENYLLIEKLSKKHSFDYTIEVDKNINQTTCQIPPMLIQPFIENAIIHAFTGLERLGNLEVSIYRKSEFLKVNIIDDGIGRKKAGEISKKGINRKSVGIDVTEQRLVAHNDAETINAIEIIDRELNQDQTGTEVKLTIRIE